RLHACQPFWFRQLEEVGIGGEPRRDADRRANRYRRTAVSLPSPRNEPCEIPPDIARDFAELSSARRTRPALARRQLAQERAILEDAIVVDRDRHNEDA